MKSNMPNQISISWIHNNASGMLIFTMTCPHMPDNMTDMVDMIYLFPNTNASTPLSNFKPHRFWTNHSIIYVWEISHAEFRNMSSNGCKSFTDPANTNLGVTVCHGFISFVNWTDLVNTSMCHNAWMHNVSNQTTSSNSTTNITSNITQTENVVTNITVNQTNTTLGHNKSSHWYWGADYCHEINNAENFLVAYNKAIWKWDFKLIVWHSL